jgi:hypothetical protein
MLQRFSPTARYCTVFAMVAFVTPAAAADASSIREGKAHFTVGLEHLRNKRYDEAYRELTKSYETNPRWTVLGNLGIAADKLERDAEAIDCMDQYLAEGQADISPKEQRQVRRDLERLRAGIATVTLQAPGAFWIVDTRVAASGAIVNEYGPFEEQAQLRIRAGEHSFELTRTDTKVAPWSATLQAGDTTTHSFAIEPVSALVEPTFVEAVEPSTAAPTDDGGSTRTHTASYVLWGVGALAAGVATGMYLESNHFQSEADREFATSCPNGPDRTDYECSGALVHDAKAANWRTASLVTGLGALGALVAGTVLYTLDLQASADRAGSSADSSAATPLRAWLGPTSFGVSGTF